MGCVRFAYTAFDRRTVTDIEGNIVKLGERSAVSSLFQSKGDKKRIAAWRSDLNRVLHVFNVRSILSLLKSLTIRFQTELALNTHVVVVDTHNIVSDIHRIVVENQGGTDRGNMSVSNRCIHPALEKSSPLPRRESGLQLQLPKNPISYT